jgi:cytochrome c-type biogenesis protein CcmH
VTPFIIFAAVMVLAAMVFATWPLWRAKSTETSASTRKERWLTAGVVVVLLPLVATLLYRHLSNWNWEQAEQSQLQAATMDEMLAKLEKHLQDKPNDEQGWSMLGRSYVALGRYPRAIEAYQKAYDLSKGEDIEAASGLAEALALTDQASLGGRAGQIFEAVLARAPNNPKALWYGAIGALDQGNLRLARDRLQKLNDQNPPEQLRSLIARQIQDLNSQLGESSPAPAAGAAPAAEGRAVKVAVAISPEVAKRLQGEASLFVLARVPGQPGPPLAVQRHTTRELPLNIELSERDAMIAARNIGTVPTVELVARVSFKGTPQAQSGDLFGSVTYTFDKDSGPAHITIDQIVP